MLVVGALLTGVVATATAVDVPVHAVVAVLEPPDAALSNDRARRGSADACYTDYNNRFSPVYGACDAFTILDVCVNNQIALETSSATIAAMTFRLVDTLPQGCSGVIDTCKGHVVRPEACVGPTTASSDSLSAGATAGAIIGGLLVLALLWLIIHSCGNHRMGRVDPKQAINAAMTTAVVRHAAVSTKLIMALPTGLPQIKSPSDPSSYDFAAGGGPGATDGQQPDYDLAANASVADEPDQASAEQPSYDLAGGGETSA